MRTFDDIKNQFVAAYKEDDECSKAFEREARKMRDAAIRYQKIAARKMTEYHKLRTKSYHGDVHWTDNLVSPLLREVKERTGLEFFSHGSGCLGLRCEYWVFANDDNGECIASLCFMPGSVCDGEIYIDTGEETGHFGKGSIGEMNGMNNKSEKVESIETVIDNLKRRYPELNITDYGTE